MPPSRHHLIEDAAESLGATYKGKDLPAPLPRIGIFSFNGNKIATTSGGGMLVSRDKKIVDQGPFFCDPGARPCGPHYEHSHIGYNYRMSNICAAIGRGQLAVFTGENRGKAQDIRFLSRKAFRHPGSRSCPKPARVNRIAG